MARTPVLTVITDEPTTYNQHVDYVVAGGSPSATVAAPIEAVDLELGLGNQSTSGCEPEDFAGFTPGSVALLQRGSCSFVIKAENAEAAGAVAVLLFNQGDSEENMGLFAGTLGDDGGTAPMLLTTHALGVAIADAAALGVVHVELHVQTDTTSGSSFNVLAETNTGDPEHVIMLGAHLDSVEDGPGINDNGSGSAVVLEIARQLAACAPNYKVRFAWWGAEERGILGSDAWVEALTQSELEQLAAYINLDMVASPNYVRYVQSDSNGPAGSTQIYDIYREWFDAHDLPTIPLPFGPNSDHHPFLQADIPCGGLFTGSDELKTPEQAAIYGGIADAPMDPCYHQACDGAQNFSLDALEQNAKATAHVIQSLATDLGLLATAPNVSNTPSR